MTTELPGRGLVYHHHRGHVFNGVIAIPLIWFIGILGQHPDSRLEIAAAVDPRADDATRQSPVVQSLWMFFTDLFAAAVPVVPFALFSLPTARIVSLSVTLVLLVFLGIGRGVIGHRRVLSTIAETIGIAATAALAGLAIGKLISLHQARRAQPGGPDPADPPRNEGCLTLGRAAGEQIAPSTISDSRRYVGDYCHASTSGWPSGLGSLARSCRGAGGQNDHQRQHRRVPPAQSLPQARRHQPRLMASEDAGRASRPVVSHPTPASSCRCWISENSASSGLSSQVTSTSAASAAVTAPAGALRHRRQRRFCNGPVLDQPP
jgi:hypothetical protein